MALKLFFLLIPVMLIQMPLAGAQEQVNPTGASPKKARTKIEVEATKEDLDKVDPSVFENIHAEILKTIELIDGAIPGHKDKTKAEPSATVSDDPAQVQKKGQPSIQVDPDLDIDAKAKKDHEVKPKPASMGTKIEETLIDGNITVSRWINTMAEGLDLWLAGQQYTDKKNETYAKVTGAVYHNKITGTRSDLEFDLRLRLPNVEEYWLLTFTSYDDSVEHGVNRSYYRNQPRERDYGASLGLVTQLGKVKTRFQPRISFDGFMQIANTLSFESVAEKKSYKINPKLKFYAEPRVGTGTFFALNFNVPLSMIYTLTYINEGDYRDRERELKVTNGVAIGQWYSDRASISYNIFVNSVSRPNYQLSGYIFSVAWSQEIYRKILDYQIIPNVSFADEYNYRVNPGINAFLNIRF